ncbi:DUF4262 domain-containing protein [Nonomuraea recticatena]|uniref:DUF4262 domain-containing protein n=1 Tax=Nonomuraea recticatena TaxID=46178 RepID=A0ABN3SU04_9ACTN
MTSTLSPHLAAVVDGVRRHGWIVQAVEGEGITPYAHTVGLLSIGMPELLVVGLPGPVAAHLLNAVAPRWMAGQIPLGGRVTVMVGDTPRTADVVWHTGGLAVAAAAVYGRENVAAAELVWTREK